MKRVLEPEIMDDPQESLDYEAMDHRVPNAAFVARLVELGATGRMLDIGTGPGQIPELVCEAIPSARVLGIDLAQTMIDLAQKRREASPHRERLEFRKCDAKGLPFEDASFDTVLSNTIIHHIADPRLVLREAMRVLKPGGALLIRDLFRPANELETRELVKLHAADCNAIQRELFRASLCAALTPDEMRAMVEEVGMPGVEVVIDSDRHMSVQRRAGS